MGIEDVSRAYTLFIDVRRSTAFMLEQPGEYLYNEAPADGGGGDDSGGGAPADMDAA